MASYNSCTFVGNLTRNVETPPTKNDTVIAKFGLAVNEPGKKDKTMFIDVTLFNKTAEIAAKYLAKGSQVLVEGKLELDTWDDKENPGKKRSKHVLVANRMTLLGSKADSGGGGEASNDNGTPF